MPQAVRRLRGERYKTRSASQRLLPAVLRAELVPSWSLHICLLACTNIAGWHQYCYCAGFRSGRGIVCMTCGSQESTAVASSALAPHLAVLERVYDA